MQKLSVLLVAMELLCMQASGNRWRGFRSSTMIFSNDSSTDTTSNCIKTWKDIPINHPWRQDCSQGILSSVPFCTGACNSFSVYSKHFPYKSSSCSCCQPTVYRKSERKVDFVCKGRTETLAFQVAAVISCQCSLCGVVPARVTDANNTTNTGL